MTDKCRVCGAVLPADAGNRRAYCSTPCRRTAEFEVRRANALVHRAQKKVQDLEAPARHPHEEERNKRQAAYWRGEVERLRGELRELVGE